MEAAEDVGLEECCAVCADPLEWVAYGPCGHRDVCSTCVARLRFVIGDKRCCICKQECEAVVVSRAANGSNLRTEEFAGLALRVRARSKSGGEFWYEPNVQAYVEDVEQFQMLKSLCRLSCSVCECVPPGVEPIRGAVRKGHMFRDIEDLRRHLSAVHKLVMCELCLEGRKVFVCEQKLYTRTQLERHAARGDSVVDGTEEERGGFAGHPFCAFCKKRFYGDNELYAHMTQIHYKCHLCEHARPGHYEYYRNYDDLEAHFRNDHLLCEDSECLAKKFVVFATEAELKRHNAVSHGGKMSRSQRNAALQIPVSLIFQYRRPRQEEGPQRGGGRRRARSFLHDGDASTSSSMHTAASLDSSLENPSRESAQVARASSGSASTGLTRASDNQPDPTPVEGSSSGGEGSLKAANIALEAGPSRYRQAVSGAGSSPLTHSAFPPLPGQSSNATSKAKFPAGSRSVASLLGCGKANIQVLNSGQSKGGRKPQEGVRTVTASASQRSMDKAVADSSAGRENSWVARVSRNVLPSTSVVDGGCPGPPAVDVQSSRGPGSGSPSGYTCWGGQLSEEEIRAGNKALVEQVRAGLQGNHQQFAEFKNLSQEWRKGVIISEDYYRHIVRLGLSHLVPELARLCPDRRKQVELLDSHNFGPVSGTSWNSSLSAGSMQEDSSNSLRGNGKCKQIADLSDGIPDSGDFPSLGPGGDEPRFTQNGVARTAVLRATLNQLKDYVGLTASGIQENTAWSANRLKSNSKGKQLAKLSDEVILDGRPSGEFPPLVPGVT